MCLCISCVLQLHTAAAAEVEAGLAGGIGAEPQMSAKQQYQKMYQPSPSPSLRPNSSSSSASLAAEDVMSRPLEVFLQEPPQPQKGLVSNDTHMYIIYTLYILHTSAHSMCFNALCTEEDRLPFCQLLDSHAQGFIHEAHYRHCTGQACLCTDRSRRGLHV